MLHDLKAVLNRCAPSLARDAAGALSLMILLYAGLHLPLLF